MITSTRIRIALAVALCTAACGEAWEPKVTLLASARLPQSTTPLPPLEARVSVDGQSTTVPVEFGRFAANFGTLSRGSLQVDVALWGTMPDNSQVLVLDAQKNVNITDAGGEVFIETTDFNLPDSLVSGIANWTLFFYGCGNSACQYLQADAGREHTCAIGMDRNIDCWGNNLQGQLALGAADVSAARGTPVQTVDAQSPAPQWRQVSAGGDTTCAIDRDGLLWCWGANGFGQVGDVAATIVRAPLVRPNPEGWAWDLVSVGGAHVCAVDVVGQLWCWGANDALQAAPTNPEIRIPLQVVHPDSQEWATVSAGERHTCALDVTGRLLCWGENRFGQIRPSDGQVALDGPFDTDWPEDRWRMVSAGARHTCAIKAGAPDLRCWGTGEHGQLGDGGTATYPTSYEVGGGYRSVIAGDEHTCALMLAGSTKCWGDTRFGRVGVTPVTGLQLPTTVLPDVAPYAELTVGARHTCRRRGAGIECFGSNDFGQLGRGTISNENVPVDARPSGVTAVALGAEHSCGITGAGFQCWGADGAGQISGGPGVDDALPRSPVYSGTPAEFTMGRAHSCALDASANLNCWGDNSHYQLGNGTADVTGGVPAIAAPAGYAWQGGIAAGADHTCASAFRASNSSFAVFCWGDNAWGQIGAAPGPGEGVTMVPNLDPLTQAPFLAAGARHTCAILRGGTTNGQLWCWGRDPVALNPRSPSQVGSDSDWIQIALGADFTCGLRDESGARSVYCWGANDQGQLGVTPGPIGPYPGAQIFDGVDQVAAGRAHGCARSGQSVTCWGANDFGQSGSGFAEPVVSAQTAVGVWRFVAAGGDHTCAITDSGANLYCWGRNTAGELGTNPSWYPTPDAVLP